MRFRGERGRKGRGVKRGGCHDGLVPGRQLQGDGAVSCVYLEMVSTWQVVENIGGDNAGVYVVLRCTTELGLGGVAHGFHGELTLPR